MIHQKGVHSIVLPPTKHFLPIGHALSFEQINSQRWQHGDHRPSSGPTLPVPYIFPPRLHDLILQTSCSNLQTRDFCCFLSGPIEGANCLLCLKISNIRIPEPPSNKIWLTYFYLLEPIYFCLTLYEHSLSKLTRSWKQIL